MSGPKPIERCPHEVPTQCKCVELAEISRQTEALKACQERCAGVERERDEWKLIATNEPHDNDQRCQLLVSKRKDAESALASSRQRAERLERERARAIQERNDYARLLARYMPTGDA